MTSLVQSDTLATAGVDTVATRNGPFITSEADEEAFRRRHGIAAPFAGVDYATSSLVGIVAPVVTEGGRVTINRVELIGDDQTNVDYAVSVRFAREGETPTRYLLHVVRVRRVDMSGRQIGTSYSYPMR